MNKTGTIAHPHPGETLKEDFMVPLDISAYKLAKAIGVSATAVGEIIAGKRGISPEMALRLEAYTGASAQFWINLQTAYDLSKAKSKASFTKRLAAIRKDAVAHEAMPAMA